MIPTDISKTSGSKDKVYVGGLLFFVLFSFLPSKSCKALAGVSVGRRAEESQLLGHKEILHFAALRLE
ncbi:hypothetical protein ES703_40271 [subsurface metagenome]